MVLLARLIGGQAEKALGCMWSY